jgi:hypothetical protein
MTSASVRISSVPLAMSSRESYLRLTVTRIDNQVDFFVKHEDDTEQRVYSSPNVDFDPVLDPIITDLTPYLKEGINTLHCVLKNGPAPGTGGPNPWHLAFKVEEVAENGGATLTLVSRDVQSSNGPSDTVVYEESVEIEGMKVAKAARA